MINLNELEQIKASCQEDIDRGHSLASHVTARQIIELVDALKKHMFPIETEDNFDGYDGCQV